MKTTCKVPFKMMISRRYYFKKPMGKLVSTNITSIKKCCQFGLPCCFFWFANFKLHPWIKHWKKHRWWLSPRMLQPSILQRGLWTIPKTTCDADWWGFPGSRRSFHTTWNWREQLSFLYKMPYKLKSDNFLIHVSTENPGKSTGTSAFKKKGWYHLDLPEIAFNPTKKNQQNPNWAAQTPTSSTNRPQELRPLRPRLRHDCDSRRFVPWDPGLGPSLNRLSFSREIPDGHLAATSAGISRLFWFSKKKLAKL